MKHPFDTAFIHRQIVAAVNVVARAHPEWAPSQMGLSVAKRVSRNLYMAARKRGLPAPHLQSSDDHLPSERKKKHRPSNYGAHARDLVGGCA